MRCDRTSTSISDDVLMLISLRCKNLTRFKLRGCREISEIGMAGLAKNCKALKKLSCGSCMFRAKGINAVIDHCAVISRSSPSSLKTLHIVKTPECSNLGLSYVVERCRLLRKLHIDGWRTNNIELSSSYRFQDIDLLYLNKLS
ncbi:F-box protein SKIP2-like [Senna tora]|uniref:F-box protein SKIP2-like n=1 Tax=Senna tora TaxID=362788 RepID=A0A834X7V9_9FABA|nr:F-box protein SKIP2-like [Senna tora]